jgi:CRP/FNR family transcriptional regulator, anaerobic regulatory protein
MNTDLLFAAIEKLTPLTVEQKTFLAGIVRERKAKKGQFLLHEGAVQKASFFVTSGLLISYYIALDGKEHLIQIAPEGWWISDLNSFTRQREALLNIRAVEESTIIELPFLQTENMFDQIPQMDKYFRVITERALINFQKRIIENNSMAARDRMSAFREHYPDLVNRLPQKLIASYLGISPEFLSKIKNETFPGGPATG